MNQMLRELFGNPADGTFVAWLADMGIWAILIALGAITVWFLLRLFIRRRLDWAADALQEFDTPSDIGGTIRSVAILLSDVVTGGMLALAAVLGILHVLGQEVGPAIGVLQNVGRAVGSWFLTDGARIGLIIFMGWVVSRLLKRWLPRLAKSTNFGQQTADDREEMAKRSETLSAVFVGTANFLVLIIVIFMVLTELSVPIGPILGGFGIAGIAVGFGAQHLVRDMINGVFILWENQYRQGDVVQIAGIAGLVESINMRRTVLRDLDGKVHVIPHGEVSITTNFTKYWSRVNINVGVAYKENLERVIEILNRIGDELSHDAYFGLLIITPPQVLRVNSFDDSAITIKMVGDCKPLKQWEISGELHLRIKREFDAASIEIPFPHQTLYWGVDQARLPWDSEVPKVEPVPTVDEFVQPGMMSPEDREIALAQLALAANTTREGDQRQRIEETTD